MMERWPGEKSGGTTALPVQRWQNAAGRRWWQPQIATAAHGFGPRAATRHSDTGGRNITGGRRWTVGQNDEFIPTPTASGSAAPLNQ
jgi:hypothetical protein